MPTIMSELTSYNQHIETFLESINSKDSDFHCPQSYVFRQNIGPVESFSHQTVTTFNESTTIS